MNMDMSSFAIRWDDSPAAGKSYFVTIWPRGLVNFSADAVNAFELERLPFVKVGFVDKPKLLVFKFLEADTEPGVLSATKRQKGIVVAARGPLEKFKVDYEGDTVRYPLERDEISGLIVAKLDEGESVSRKKKKTDG